MEPVTARDMLSRLHEAAIKYDAAQELAVMERPWDAGDPRYELSRILRTAAPADA